MRPAHRKIPAEQPGPAWRRLFGLEDIEALLQACAKKGQAISYADTLDCLGYAFSRPKMRALCVALAELDRRAASRDEPELAVLVVRASDGLPGAGWWTGRADGYRGPWDGKLAQAHVKALQERAFQYWRATK